MKIRFSLYDMRKSTKQRLSFLLQAIVYFSRMFHPDCTLLSGHDLGWLHYNEL